MILVRCKIMDKKLYIDAKHRCIVSNSSDTTKIKLNQKYSIGRKLRILPTNILFLVSS